MVFLVRMKVDNELVITNEYKSVSTDAHININIMLRMSGTKLKDDKDVIFIVSYLFVMLVLINRKWLI